MRCCDSRNSGKDEKVWPYCQPDLAALYGNVTTCDQGAKDWASCTVPAAMRIWSGDHDCRHHEGCSGGGYCHTGLRATPAPLV
jgi:hypothetical protein